MDLLKNWVSNTVEQGLGAVLQETKACGQLDQAKHVPYEDDGSNLRIPSSKIGVVQIIKVWVQGKDF